MDNEFQIIRILEPDFGCEGLPDDKELTDKVYIKNRQGAEKVIEVEDALLYRLNLDEGDWLCLSENGTVSKINC